MNICQQANILVRHDLVIQLSDFGLSRFGDPTSMTNGTHVGGTARWMAPEIVHGAKPEYCSDVYSFACVWIEVRLFFDMRAIVGLTRSQSFL